MRIDWTSFARTGLLLATVWAGTTAAATATAASADEIPWITNYGQAAQEAARTGKPILVEVTAPWCGYCQLKHQQTFTDRKVIRHLNLHFIPLEIDADKQPDLVEAFHIQSLPTTVIVSPDLKIVKRLTGFQAAPEFNQELGQIAQAYPSRTMEAEGLVVSAEQPANVSRYGFGDYCLVTMLETNQLKKGSPDHVATYHGIEVCFITAEQKQKFLADPEKYWPVDNGRCPVSQHDENAPQLGDPQNAVTWHGRLWFFADRVRRQRFIKAPHRYLHGVM